MIKVINCCPHPITFISNGGQEITFEKSPEHQARVSEIQVPSSIYREGLPVFVGEYGDISGLPESQPDRVFIVSGMVLAALKHKGCMRSDILAPATGPGDNPVRDHKGQIVAVTQFKGLV